MSTSGSKSNEHVAHFLVDIHTYLLPVEISMISRFTNNNMHIVFRIKLIFNYIKIQFLFVIFFPIIFSKET